MSLLEKRHLNTHNSVKHEVLIEQYFTAFNPGQSGVEKPGHSYFCIRFQYVLSQVMDKVSVRRVVAETKDFVNSLISALKRSNELIASEHADVRDKRLKRDSVPHFNN